jgi:hypothetical protein
MVGTAIPAGTTTGPTKATIGSASIPVDDAEAYGLEAERAYASDGRSLGEAEECDLLIRDTDAQVLEAVRVQAKRRKSIAQYLTPPEGADINVIRENYGESLAVVPWDLFLELLEEAGSGVASNE